MKKETILTIAVCVLVVVSVVGIPFGYFAGKGEREVVASNCGVVVCAGLPEIPECPDCPDFNLTCPECEECRSVFDLSNPEDFLIWSWDNKSKTLNITYFDHWYSINRTKSFQNWTEIVDWMMFITVPEFISERQHIVLAFLALNWAYYEAIDNWP